MFFAKKKHLILVQKIDYDMGVVFDTLEKAVVTLHVWESIVNVTDEL